jgi:hypothetical protein
VGVEINLSTGHRKIMSKNRIPDWAIEYVRQAKEQMGLQFWNIKLVPDSQPNPDNPHSDAVCCANPETYVCFIRIRPGVIKIDNESARMLLVHELIHICMANQYRTVWDLLTGYVPEGDQRAMAISLFRVADEQFVVRMADSLVDLIRYTPKPIITVTISENSPTVE